MRKSIVDRDILPAFKNVFSSRSVPRPASPVQQGEGPGSACHSHPRPGHREAGLCLRHPPRGKGGQPGGWRRCRIALYCTVASLPVLGRHLTPGVLEPATFIHGEFKAAGIWSRIYGRMVAQHRPNTSQRLVYARLCCAITPALRANDAIARDEPASPGPHRRRRARA